MLSPSRENQSHTRRKKTNQTAELIRGDEAVAHSIQTITGRDPAWFSSMLPNVERLVQRAREMEAVTVSK